MNQYPDYPQWQNILLSQYSGELLWCGFITGLLLLWLMWRGLFKRWQVVITFVAVGVFYFSIALPILINLDTRRGLELLFWGLVIAIIFTNLIPAYGEDTAIVGVLVLGLGLRLLNIFTEPLWYDEAATAVFSSVPIQNIWSLGGDTHPPLFYLPFWLSANLFGNSAFALRLPSLAFGVLTVYLIYRLTLALGMKRKTALIAALIVAVLPGALRYSNEARGYAQLAACVIGMAISVLENRPRWFAGLAAATLLTHNMGYVYVAVIGGVAFFWYIHRTEILTLPNSKLGYINWWNVGPFRFYFYQRFEGWTLALLIPALVGLAWLPFMIQQFQSISSGWWVVMSPGAIIRPLFELTIGVRVDEAVLLQSLTVILVLTLLGLLAVRKWLLTTKGNLWFVLCFATPAIAAIVSLWTPVYVNRAFLPSFLVIPIVWAYLITEGKPFDRVAAAGVLVPVLAFAVASYFVPTREQRDDWSVLLPQGCEGAETIYSTNLHTYTMSRYYLPDRRVVLWTNANDVNFFLPQHIKDALNIEQAASLPSGDVCVFQTTYYLTRQVERDYVVSILNTYPHNQPFVISEDVYSTLSAYVVSVP